MSWNNNHQMFLFLCFGLGVGFAFEMFFLCFSIPVISSISFCFSCCCLYSLNSFYNVFFYPFLTSYLTRPSSCFYIICLDYFLNINFIFSKQPPYLD